MGLGPQTAVAMVPLSNVSMERWRAGFPLKPRERGYEQDLSKDPS